MSRNSNTETFDINVNLFFNKEEETKQITDPGLYLALREHLNAAALKSYGKNMSVDIDLGRMKPEREADKDLICYTVTVSGTYEYTTEHIKASSDQYGRIVEPEYFCSDSIEETDLELWAENTVVDFMAEHLDSEFRYTTYVESFDDGHPYDEELEM